MIDKLLLKKRFEKSLETYDENAIVQNEMAIKLIDLIKSQGNSFDRIFEFGVGSGNLTRLITENFEYKELFLNDIVKKSAFWAKKYTDGFEFIHGDIEKIIYPENLNLITSNAAVQWVKDLDTLLEKVSNSLEKDGLFAFSTFGEENFIEIQKVFGISLNYLPIDVLQEKLSKRFNILHFEINKRELEFDTPSDVLKHIKNTGVNCLSVKNFYKSGLIKFNSEYKKLFASEKGVKLTYNPIYALVQKN